MNINNITNRPTFGSNYKFNLTSENQERIQDLMPILTYPEMHDNNYIVSSKFPAIDPYSDFNVYEQVLISADDKYDKFIESILKQRNIEFKKQSKEEALDIKNIFNRTILPEFNRNRLLVTLDTQKVEDLFKEETDMYVSCQAKSQGIERRYKKAQEFFSTGQDIEAVELQLHEENGKLKSNIIDGRHRFAVMRDMGMKKIKFSLDEISAKLAKKYGLIAK